jgi:hypothetical protein
MATSTLNPQPYTPRLPQYPPYQQLPIRSHITNSTIRRDGHIQNCKNVLQLAQLPTARHPGLLCLLSRPAHVRW